MKDSTLAKSSEFINLGLSKQNKSEYQLAIQYYCQAIEIREEDSKPYCLRALCSIELENYNYAISDLEKAIKYSNGKKSIYFFYIAKVLFIKKEYEKSIKNYTIFIENDLKLAENSIIYLTAFFDRGNARKITGDSLGAILDWAYILEIYKKKNSPFFKDRVISKKPKKINNYEKLFLATCNKLARERVKDKKTYDELSKLETKQQLLLSDNLNIYRQWIDSDYSNIFKIDKKNK